MVALLKKAHELSVLNIGAWYSVAHAKIKFKDSGKIVFIPISPLLHKDPQFGADFRHYHIDGRFNLPQGFNDYFAIKDGLTNCPVAIDGSEGIVLNYDVLEIIYKRKKCVRTITGVRPPLTESVFSPHPSKYVIWYETMVGKSCKGRKCPHLGTIMNERNGELICPLHNLRGGIKEEVILPLPVTPIGK